MIRIEAFSKYFNKGGINQVLALNQIQLTVHTGDFITIIGSNGAGKSTLLNCLAGTYYCDSGRILLGEKDITFLPEFKRAAFISRVFQDPLLGTCASLSIEQNLSLAARRGRSRGLGAGVRKKDRKRFREALSSLGLGLENRLKDKVGLLSGGQRQAITMLMATLVKPEVLLLDEHTAALDPKTANQILDLTRNLVTGFTTLMVTHNMKQAIRLGNRLIMFHRGKIIMDISGEEKDHLQVEDLLHRFYESQGEEIASDRMLLSSE